MTKKEWPFKKINVYFIRQFSEVRGGKKKRWKTLLLVSENKTERKLNAFNLSHFKPRWKGRNDRKCPLIHGNHDLNELYTANSLFCAGHLTYGLAPLTLPDFKEKTFDITVG